MESTRRCSNDFISSFEVAPKMNQKKYHIPIQNNFNVTEFICQAKFCSSTNILELINEVEKVVKFVENAVKIKQNKTKIGEIEEMNPAFVSQMNLID